METGAEDDWVFTEFYRVLHGSHLFGRVEPLVGGRVLSEAEGLRSARHDRHLERRRWSSNNIEMDLQIHCSSSSHLSSNLKLLLLFQILLF